MPATITFQYQSASGSTFAVSPSLVGDIEGLINQVRSEIAIQKAAGLFVGYLSVPISPRSGGDFQTNKAVAAHAAIRLRTEFGSRLWLLNPAAYNLPDAATGSDYMAVWAAILAGLDGTGGDFDLAYFLGPSDVWAFFGVGGTDRIGTIETWLAARAATEPAYKAIYDDPKKRTQFLRYYGLRGSTIFSKGGHDEWNIVVALNGRRPIGEDIAVYFDGKPVEPGDYSSPVDAGNALVLH